MVSCPYLLDIEPEVNDIPILYRVLFPLDPHVPLRACRVLAAALDEIPVVGHFRPDEPRSKSVWILPAACGAFVPFGIVHEWSSFSLWVKKLIRSQQLEAFADDAGESRFLNADVVQILFLFFGRELKEFRLGLAADLHQDNSLPAPHTPSMPADGRRL